MEDVRAQLIPSFISLAVVLAAYWFKTSAERRSAAVPAGAAYPRAGSLGRVLRRMHDENVAR